MNGSFAASLYNCRMTDLLTPPAWIAQETYSDLTQSRSVIGKRQELVFLWHRCIAYITNGGGIPCLWVGEVWAR